MVRIRIARRRAGMSALEALLSLSILSLVLVAGVGVMSTTVRSWTGGTRRVDAENETAYAVRYIASRIQEACMISVASDGMSVTYWMPQKDEDGNYRMPVTPETESRSFSVSNGTLYETDGHGTRELLAYVSSTDPSIPGSDKSYVPFEAGAGSVPRVLSVHLATERSGVNSETPVRSRHRQIIYLRNVPTPN